MHAWRHEFNSLELTDIERNNPIKLSFNLFKHQYPHMHVRLRHKDNNKGQQDGSVVKILATKYDNLSTITKAYILGENWLLRVVF